jgi:hypothetical protein
MKTLKLLSNTFKAVSAVVTAYQLAKSVKPAVKVALKAVKALKS